MNEKKELQNTAAEDNATSSSNKSRRGRHGKKGTSEKSGGSKRIASSITDITNFLPNGYTGTAIDTVPVNFSVTLGDNLSLSSNKITGKFETPGIAALEMAATIGPQSEQWLDSQYNAITECAASMYAKIRMSNNGSRQYDPSDLMLYIYSLGSAYSIFGFLRAVYGVATRFNFYNEYMPYRLIQAMGFDHPYEILNNLAQFRDILNTYARRLSIYPIPGNIPVLQRMIHMYDNLYADTLAERSRLYVMKPAGFYKYGGVAQPNQLTFYSWKESIASCCTEGNLLDGLVEILDTIIDPLIDNSVELGEIKRDLLATFSSSEWIVPPEIPVDYVVEPIYDPSVLVAIHNATITGAVPGNITASTSTGRISQSFSNISTEGEWINDKTIVNLPYTKIADVSPAAVLTATMFTALVGNTARGDKLWAIPDHIISSVTIYSMDSEHPLEKLLVKIPRSSNNGQEYWITTDEAFRTYMLASKFSYFPMLYLGLDDTGTSTAESSYEYFVNCEVDTFRVYDVEELIKIHRVKMEGLFGLPYHFG